VAKLNEKKLLVWLYVIFIRIEVTPIVHDMAVRQVVHCTVTNSHENDVKFHAAIIQRI
jgi:hypothetical protein